MYVCVFKSIHFCKFLLSLTTFRLLVIEDSSSSFILLDLEEVLAFKSAILRKVSAVNSVANAVDTETSAQSVWP